MSQERPTEWDVPLDDRTLAVETSGKADGFPVFLMHGMPGSRSGPKPRSMILHLLGIRLICYDRPGYGRSTRRQGRRVVDAALDVQAIADRLELEKFAVVGRSGGGPHALACAASDLFTDRLTRVAVLVSPAPIDAPGLDWYAGMAPSNIEAYREATSDRRRLIESLTLRADRTRQDPASVVSFIDGELSPADRNVVEDVALRRLLTESYAEAVRFGADGWIDDALALSQDWGFDPSSIKVPVRLWHGAEDAFSPVAHTRWLKSQIPHAEFEEQPGVGHFAAMQILPDILAWLATPLPELVDVRPGGRV
ncbi:alpha/beta fold hydrolase [Micromonospora sp. CA-263727]|uniref:alpha/beta fold hydrolase n=1 Tax=Micromonospora sp. CA-263727 TaxID=3239967 RepID=UPI003D8FDCE9